ncbi:IPIL1 protein, partial [Galbula dea]|nr:IPIL1 protein [Galbula dea]
IFAKRTRWPLKGLAKRSQIVKKVVDDLLHVLQLDLSNSFLPVLQPAIGVGSAFEGWSPSDDEPVYRLLVPLKPPHGYSFCLELGKTGEMPSKECHICVDLECICSNNKTTCIVHHPVKELRKRHEGLSLRNTLCTGSYLDVQKTARWIQGLVRSAWGRVPHSQHYKMKMLPSKNSCKMQLTNASKETLTVELIFGVQQGNSDIFLCSQTPEAVVNSSTTWPMSCAVAEAKLFRQIATKAPRGSFHLECLHACTRILVGTSFSTSMLKTVVMHLLTTIPLGAWRKKDFVLRLEDIMQYLHGCLQEKRLNHFFFGNKSVPKEIILPPEFQTAEPYNLFHHLVEDPVAHARALEEFEEL